MFNFAIRLGATLVASLAVLAVLASVAFAWASPVQPAGRTAVVGLASDRHVVLSEAPRGTSAPGDSWSYGSLTGDRLVGADARGGVVDRTAGLYDPFGAPVTGCE